MSKALLGKLILNSAVNFYVKPLLNKETRRKLFHESLEKEIYAEVKTVSTKIDRLNDKVSKLQIQPSYRAFNKEINFYTKRVIPTIKEICGNEEVNSSQIEELATKLDTKCSNFSDEIHNAWGVISDEVNSCNFSVRILFGLTKDMYCLHLAMLSWTRGLYSLIDGKQYKLKSYDGYIEDCINTCSKLSQEYADKLYESRLSLIKFKHTEKSHDEYPRDHGGYPVRFYDKVYCLYEDEFTSTDDKDPFKSTNFRYEINKKYSVWPWKPGKLEMAQAAVKADKYSEEHEEHKNKVTELCKKYIKGSNQKFLDTWDEIVQKKKLN